MKPSHSTKILKLKKGEVTDSSQVITLNDILPDKARGEYELVLTVTDVITGRKVEQVFTSQEIGDAQKVADEQASSTQVTQALKKHTNCYLRSDGIVKIVTPKMNELEIPGYDRHVKVRVVPYGSGEKVQVIPAGCNYYFTPEPGKDYRILLTAAGGQSSKAEPVTAVLRYSKSRKPLPSSETEITA